MLYVTLRMQCELAFMMPTMVYLHVITLLPVLNEIIKTPLHRISRRLPLSIKKNTKYTDKPPQLYWNLPNLNMMEPVMASRDILCTIVHGKNLMVLHFNEVFTRKKWSDY